MAWSVTYMYLLFVRYSPNVQWQQELLIIPSLIRVFRAPILFVLCNNLISNHYSSIWCNDIVSFYSDGAWNVKCSIFILKSIDYSNTKLQSFRITVYFPTEILILTNKCSFMPNHCQCRGVGGTHAIESKGGCGGEVVGPYSKDSKYLYICTY